MTNNIRLIGLAVVLALNLIVVPLGEAQHAATVPPRRRAPQRRVTPDDAELDLLYSARL